MPFCNLIIERPLYSGHI